MEVKNTSFTRLRKELASHNQEIDDEIDKLQKDLEDKAKLLEIKRREALHNKLLNNERIKQEELKKLKLDKKGFRGRGTSLFKNSTAKTAE